MSVIVFFKILWFYEFIKKPFETRRSTKATKENPKKAGAFPRCGTLCLGSFPNTDHRRLHDGAQRFFFLDGKQLLLANGESPP